MSEPVAAVICDIVDSRQHDDRRIAHDQVLRAFEQAGRSIPVLTSPYPTVGDEFQAVYPKLEHALVATIRFSLFLAEGMQCRFGIGVGDDRRVATDRANVIRDGSAWWRAREAIVEVRDVERAGRRTARTGLRVAEPAHGCDARALLALQDHIVGRMQSRERRIAASALDGMRQADIASIERISQAAVSKSLRRSGGSALVAAVEELKASPRW